MYSSHKYTHSAPGHLRENPWMSSAHPTELGIHEMAQLTTEPRNGPLITWCRAGKTAVLRLQPQARLLWSKPHCTQWDITSIDRIELNIIYALLQQIIGVYVNNSFMYQNSTCNTAIILTYFTKLLIGTL